MITRAATLSLAVAVLCGCAATSGVPTAGNFAASPCLKDTGSRLPATGGTCFPGRSYSKSDIDATGETTAAGALRLMDPAITVH